MAAVKQMTGDIREPLATQSSAPPIHIGRMKSGEGPHGPKLRGARTISINDD
jgi:hypothetical protein